MNILDYLGLIFIALKLHGSISWDWWYVLLPLTISLIVAILGGTDDE